MDRGAWRATVHVSVLAAQSCPTLQPHGLLCLWNSPDKNTGVGCHYLLQRRSPWGHTKWDTT